MQFFDGDRVHDLLPYDALIPALAEAHRIDVDAVESTVLEQPGEIGADHFLALPAWQRGRAVGSKLVSVFPVNEKNGSDLPSVQAVYVLFDGADGRPLAVIDGTVLTLRKTASDSGVGASFLAASAPERMLMVGAGAMGPHLIQAHLAARPSITQVSVWNRTPERAEALAASLTLPGVQIAATQDLEGAARAADVISCATMATEPLIMGEWLKPGAHLDLVGSYRTDMQECDAAALQRGSLFVDSPWSAPRDSGEIVSAMATGAITEADILATNFDLVRGKHPGRTSDDEITVYKNGGGGHLDLMVAQILMELAG